MYGVSHTAELRADGLCQENGRLEVLDSLYEADGLLGGKTMTIA